MRPGDIVLLDWPFSDLSGAKRRPALVLNVYKNNDALLAFITSVQPGQRDTCWIDLKKDNLNRLKIDSFIRADKLLLAHESLISSIYGRISEMKFTEVINAIKLFLDSIKYS
jgi:mRNA interferase MazF